MFLFSELQITISCFKGHPPKQFSLFLQEGQLKNNLLLNLINLSEFQTSSTEEFFKETPYIKFWSKEQGVIIKSEFIYAENLPPSQESILVLSIESE